MIKPTELETIVMNLISSIEKDTEGIKQNEDKRIAELQQEFSELFEQLTKLSNLQTRLEQATTTLEKISKQITNL